MSELTVTHTSAVTPDRIDHLGHMNVRYYGVDARAGGQAFIATHAPAGADLAVAPVDIYTRHLAEQLEGAALEVHTGVLDAVPGSLTLYHELRNRQTGVLAASFVHRLVAMGPEGPSTAWPPDPDALARVDIPEAGRPRTISLEGMQPSADESLLAGPVGPDLDEVRARGLAIRHPREVQAEECDSAGTVTVEDAPFLVWGGEPIGERDGPMLHEGPDGARIGMASMESRLRIHRLPRVGDRIQSHGAVLHIADKVSHHVHWAHDLARGDALVAFEVVNLAFDTVERRAVPLSPEMRASMTERLHPDLAPA